MAVQGLQGGFPADIFAQQPVPDFLICPSCKHVRVTPRCTAVKLTHSPCNYVCMLFCGPLPVPPSYKVVNDPRNCRQGHVFCNSCIAAAIKVGDGDGGVCPVDGAPVSHDRFASSAPNALIILAVPYSHSHLLPTALPATFPWKAWWAGLPSSAHTTAASVTGLAP